MRRSRYHPSLKNGADIVFDLICGRWKVPILLELHGGPRRTGQLVRALQGVSKNRLNDNLRELQRAGVVRRRVYVGAVTRVEYEVSPLGRTLGRIVEDLRRWGERNRRAIERERGKPLKRR